MNQEFIYKLAEKLQKVGTIHAIGETWISFDSSIPAGGVPFCGQLVSRAAWTDLFAWATAQGKVKTETEWQAHAAANGGNCPFYSDGDGSTTFRMPCVSSYLKGATSASKAGQYKAPALPNIRGAFNANQLQDGTECASGALVVGGAEARVTPGSTSDGSQNGFSFDASKYDPRYQDGADVTPETFEVIVGVYAVGIVTRTGSTDLDAVLTGIAQAEETANNVSNELANNLGNLAKLQSFFNGTFTKTLLAGGIAKSDWMGAGAITLSESWKNFDALVAFTTNDYSDSVTTLQIAWKWQLEWLLELGASSGKKYFAPVLNPRGTYYEFRVSSTTELLLADPNENAGIQAIYGIKLRGTGVTNASAIDVSQVQSRLAGMLTDDNHLILPSGLEVW